MVGWYVYRSLLNKNKSTINLRIITIASLPNSFDNLANIMRDMIFNEVKSLEIICL